MSPRPARLAALAGAGLALAACAPLPEGVDEAQAAAYDAAVASVGCTLVHEGHYEAVTLQTGLTRDQISALSRARMAQGRAERRADGAVILKTGTCA